MALCFVHGAAGYLAYEAVRRNGPPRPALLAAAVTLANAPDLDFLPGLLVGHPSIFHRGLTHTIAAAVAVGAVTWIACRILRRHQRAALWAALWVAATYASHLVLDFFTTDAKPPHGAPLLWPLSDRYLISPVTPFGEVIIDPSGRAAFLRSLIQPAALRVWVAEVALLVLVVVAVRIVRLVRAALEAGPVEVPDEP